MTDLVLYKTYDQESIADLERDVSEAIEGEYSTGFFTVRIEWTYYDPSTD